MKNNLKNKGWIELLLGLVLFALPFFLLKGSEDFLKIIMLTLLFWFFALLLFILGALDVLKNSPKNKTK